MKRNRHRRNKCRSKKAYDTLEAAQAASEHMREQSRIAGGYWKSVLHRLHAYRCGYCKRYHIGHSRAGH